MAPVLQMFTVIITAAVLTTLTSSHKLKETLYAVTLSSRLRGGYQESLCAQIHDPIEPICLTVILQMETGRKKNVIVETSITRDFYRCFDFKVPEVSMITVANVIIVLEGRKDTITKKTKVLIEPPTCIHIVQTDKPIYTPGQPVRFRMVSLDTDFVPKARVYDSVVLQDPNSNRIAQWLDKSIDVGILDFSHPMNSDAEQGTYTISAITDKGEKITHTFVVKEFVPPKYEVTVQLPSMVSVMDEEAPLKICGKYTYGKPVQGSIKAVFCRIGSVYWYYRTKDINPCKTYNMTTDKSGCATQKVNMAEFFLTNFMYINSFEVTAELEEFGTGVTLKGDARMTINRYVRSASFMETPVAYKPGLTFEGKIKVIGPDNQPVSNAYVTLSTSSSQRVKLTTDTSGMASFSLDTSLWKDTVSLTATPEKIKIPTYPKYNAYYSSAYHSALRFYSMSHSFLKIMLADGKISCDRDATVHAQYIIQGKALRYETDTLTFFYLVMSKGVMKQYGRVHVSVEHVIVNKGELSITLGQVTKLAPYAQVIIYTVLPSGEVVADSMNFPVELCFNNKVSLKFSSVQQLPAEETKLQLNAEPGSMCSVRAIDLSILLQQPEQELTVDYMYNQLPLQMLSGYDYRVDDNEPYPCEGGDPELSPGPSPGPVTLPFQPIVPDIKIWTPYVLYEQNDAFSRFKETGTKLLTNMLSKKPCDCSPVPAFFSYFTLDSKIMMPFVVPDTLQNVQPSEAQGNPAPPAEEKVEEATRSFFPHTWIWDLVIVGDNGSVKLKETVPDTITKWVAGAFCVSSSEGFGVSPNVGLTAFKPIFVSLTLPYSVIRGESFTLKATVFNYLSDCIMMKITLAGSDQYTYQKCAGCQYSVCLCAEESLTFSWIVTPTALGQVNMKVSAEALKTGKLCGEKPTTIPEKGQVDTVIRDLLVEAEGTPQMVSHSALLCPAKETVEENMSLELPKDYVEGSVRASVSVLGDLMGMALKNVQDLLRMPYGCGEQNMLKFAPNVFILDYLMSTNQLTKDILDKTDDYMKSGYMRQLQYKHPDGSYSAFGTGDKSGNTWLTTFVMKSFGGASSYIFVDSGHIDHAKKWLSGLQRTDGCFNSVGKLFHNGMKGGVSDDVTLTAYIVAAMLELDDDVTDPAVLNGLLCLKSALNGTVNNLYTTALLSYTFTLANDEAMRMKLLTELHLKSEAAGGTRHLVRVGAPTMHLDSLEVEMTSYFLLALLSGPTLLDFNLGYASSIVRWIIKQQNPQGGFSSTQDTVVALQALAKYAAATYSKEGTVAVTVSSPKGQLKKFTVDESNRLLYQEEELSDVPGKYAVRAKGEGCALVQISMFYNIPPPPDTSSFNITATLLGMCDMQQPQLLFVLVRYQGPREETNMVIINIKLLSGYIVEESSVQLLKDNPLVKRVEVEAGHLIIYVDGMMQGEERLYIVLMQQDQPVKDLKPAVVKVFDYYQTSDEAVTEYTTPCKE
ncbi:alpha-2-macroglobulin-like protein 1 [Labrus bergylta]|uniref:alpha-2-macroglobulin-like protein 1 n=1 Tax=Labrus bergylta TaxID=56723 RepID=UPI0033141B50